MNEDAVAETVRHLLADVLGKDAAAIVPEARILDDLGAESIDLLDMRFRIEQAFEIKVTGDDLARAVGGGITRIEFGVRFTVRALTDYVIERLRQMRDA
jgi:acyl carrier protein